MKRILVLVLLVFTAVAAYSVSGRIFMRIGAYKDGVTDTNWIGPMFSYWGPSSQNNSDLWLGKEGGTGFEINFDSFSILYKTRDWIYLPGCLDISGYSWQPQWAAQKGYASSPGYVQFRNLRVGSAVMAAGIGLWQLVANKEQVDIIASGATTNSNVTGSIGFIKGYVDYKIDLPINEYIKIKLMDWDLMFIEAYYGGSTLKGNIGGAFSTNAAGAGGVKVYLPPHLLLNLDQFQMDFSPRVIVDTSFSNKTIYTSGGTEKHAWGDNYFRFGAYLRLTYFFTRSLSVYGMFGYFNESLQSVIDKVNNLTNVSYSSFSANIIPIFGGLRIMPTSAITLTVGYGVNLALNNSLVRVDGGGTNYFEYGPQIRTGYMNTISNSNYNYMLNPERNTYGDTLMDSAFLRFGADFKIVNEWSFGMYSAVSLNDSWTWGWLNTGSMSQTISNTAEVHKVSVNDWLSFLNWMNYDNNMYLKFENDVFAARLTFDAYARPAQVDATILNLFAYLDFTYKF